MSEENSVLVDREGAVTIISTHARRSEASHEIGPRDCTWISVGHPGQRRCQTRTPGRVVWKVPSDYR